MANYIKAMGLELEAGWKEKPKIAGIKLVRDSSISAKGYEYEMVTKPYKRKRNILKTIKKAIAYIDETPLSCGIHIHISLKEKEEYYNLLSTKFIKYYEKKLNNYSLRKGKDYGKLRERIKNSRWCKEYKEKTKKEILMLIEEQAIYGRNRYYGVNFSLSKHGTIEFRSFPSTKNILFIKNTIIFLEKTVNSFIEKYNNKDLQCTLQCNIIEEEEEEIKEVIV